MNIIRIYYNAANETLRVDRVTISVKPPVYKELRAGNDPGLQMLLGPQVLRTIPMGSSASLAGSRAVANIEITGDYDDWDQTGPAYNITWATKTLGNAQVVRFDMSNLPVIGDTI